MDLFDIVAARVGSSSGGGVPQVQSDWEQDDSSRKSFIKNKPFVSELVEKNYTYEFNTNFTNIDKFMDFIEEEKYSFHIEATQGTQSLEWDFEDIKEVNMSNIMGIDCPGFVISPQGVFNNPSVVDENLVFILMNEIYVTDTFHPCESKNNCVILAKCTLFENGVEENYSFSIKNIEAESEIVEDYVPLLQPNWEENDCTSEGFIHNRPFYEIDETEYTTSPVIEFRFRLNDDYSTNDDSINYASPHLVADTIYESNSVIIMEGTTIPTSFSFTTEEADAHHFGIEDGGTVVVAGLPVATIIDGVNAQTQGSEILFVRDEESCVIIPTNASDSTYWNVDFTCTGLLGKKKIKKIDKKFLPIADVPVATSTQLGIVQGASTRQSDHTQPVSVDSNGKLWTKAVNGLSSVSWDIDAGKTGSIIRHPVYRNNSGLLYAKVLTADSNYVGGVKVSEIRGHATGSLPCFMYGDFIYATMPTAATIIDSTSTSFPTTKAVYDYVADQINTIYADLEGDVY